MLSCREVSKQSSLYLDGELPRRERMAMTMHLLMCHHCRRFVRQVSALIRSIPFMHGQASPEELQNVLAYISKNAGEQAGSQL